MKDLIKWLLIELSHAPTLQEFKSKLELLDTICDGVSDYTAEEIAKRLLEAANAE